MNSAEPSVLAGSVGIITGLKSASHLNGRLAIVLRPATSPSLRHDVFVVSSSNTSSYFVRVKPQNMQIRSSVGQSSTPTTVADSITLLPPHPLTALPFFRIEDVISSASAPQPTNLYFASFTPSYLFLSLDTTKQQRSFSILQLATSDLRNALYSIHHLNNKNVNIHFTMNDFTTIKTTKPFVIARNLVILWLILKTNCPTSVIAEIWFSLRLSDRSYAYLLDAIYALTECGQNSTKCSQLADIGVVDMGEKQWMDVKAFMTEWIQWHCEFGSWEKLSKHRTRALEKSLNRSLSAMADGMSESLLFSRHVKGDSSLPKDALVTEVSNYVQTGCLKQDPKNPQCHTNPTLFQHPKEYDVYDASLPFFCGSSFVTTYDSKYPLHAMLHSSLTQWIHTLRSYPKGKITWSMHMEDYISFCMKLNRPYDLAFISNLPESTGLLSILQSLKNVIKYGVLQTTKQLLPHFNGSIHKYFEKKLKYIPIQMLSPLLGWRCVGRNGNNEEHWQTLIPGSDRRDMDCMLMWAPEKTSDKESIKVDLQNTHSIRLMYNGLRDDLFDRNNYCLDRNCDKYSNFYPNQQKRDKKSFSYVMHPFVLLPLFVSNWLPSSKFIDDLSLRDVEFMDVFKFLVCENSENGEKIELSKATFTVPRSTFRTWGRMVVPIIDQRDAYSVRLNNLSYFALNAQQSGDEWKISWLIAKHRLKQVQGVELIFGADIVIANIPVEAVKLQPTHRSEWNDWIFNRNLSNGTAEEGRLQVTRVERSYDMDLALKCNIPLARRCEIAIEKRKQDEIQLIVKDSKGSTQTFIRNVPYHLKPIRITKSISKLKDKCNYVTLEKDKYVPPKFMKGAFAKSMFIEDPMVPGGFLNWLLPQIWSPEETLRASLGRLHWDDYVFYKSALSSLIVSAVAGDDGYCILYVDDNEKLNIPSISRTTFRDQAEARQKLILDPVGCGDGKRGFWRHEKTGCVALRVKWTLYPKMFSKRKSHGDTTTGNAPPCISKKEMDTLVRILESCSDGDMKQQDDIKMDGLGQSLFQVSKLAKKLHELGKGTLSPEEEAKIEEEALLMQGCKFGTSMFVIEAWEGQADMLIASSASSDINWKTVDTLNYTCNGAGWVNKVNGWLQKSMEYENKGMIHRQLEALQVGIFHGLQITDNTLPDLLTIHGSKPKMKTDEDTYGNGKKAVVQCLLKAAQCRVRLGIDDLVVPSLNKALQLIEQGYSDKIFTGDNVHEINDLREQAEKLHAKALDRALQ